MQKSAEVASYFHRTADEFDALYNEGTLLKSRINRFVRGGLYARVTLTVKELDAMDRPTVLDVGCGSGRNSVIFVKQADVAHLTGVDFSERMIELAKETAAEHNVEDQCDFILQDVLTYKPVEKFDAVVALGVFDYVEDPAPFLHQLAKLCRGKILASFPGNALVRSTLRKIRYNMRGCPLYFYTEDRLRSVVQEAGITSFRIIPYASSGLFLVADCTE